MSALIEGSLIALSLTWIAVTALYQVRDWWLLRPVFDKIPADILGILPIWTFFSPVPGHTDVHVVYRTRSADGHAEDWKRIEIIRSRSISSSLFNPNRRLTKALIDIVSEVTRSSEFDADLYNSFFVFQPTHLFLLNLALSRSSKVTDDQVQYAVFVTRGFSDDADIQTICRSNFHSV